MGAAPRFGDEALVAALDHEAERLGQVRTSPPGLAPDAGKGRLRDGRALGPAQRAEVAPQGVGHVRRARNLHPGPVLRPRGPAATAGWARHGLASAIRFARRSGLDGRGSRDGQRDAGQPPGVCGRPRPQPAIGRQRHLLGPRIPTPSTRRVGIPPGEGG